MQRFTNGQTEKIRVLMLGASLNVKGGITSVEKLILESAPPKLDISHVPTFTQGSSLKNIKIFLQAIRTLTYTLATRKTDLVHIHFAERGSTLRKAILTTIILSFGYPFILHAHGATFQEFFQGLPQLFQYLIANLFGRCTKFIALSESWRNYYLQQFQLKENQIVVLHNPVKLPLEYPQRLNRKLVTFVFLGRIGKRGGALDLAASVVAFPKQDKGAFDLIKAFAALPEQGRNCARLILAGNGDVELAQQLIQELGLEDRITVHSWLNPTQRDELLAEADVFVLPSYNEGLPMSMLEAMAWGLPVITTPVGGIPEVISDRQNGLLVQPGNQEQLVQAIQTLLVDEELRLSLGNAARKCVQSFDIQNYISSLLELYRLVSKNHQKQADLPQIVKSSSSGC